MDSEVIALFAKMLRNLTWAITIFGMLNVFMLSIVVLSIQTLIRVIENKGDEDENTGEG